MLRLKTFHRKMVLHFKEQRISITNSFNCKTTFTRKLALMANGKFNACSITFIRKWYVEFPLMCAGVLLLKTPAIRYLSIKRPVYKLVTITSKHDQ